MQETATIIAAFDHLLTIGDSGSVPWQLSADLKYFKRRTMGHPIIMGRKTHESIGAVLPGRTNIVVTRSETYSKPGIQVCHSPDEAMAEAKSRDSEAYVIGGTTIYEALFPQIDAMCLTVVHAEIGGDTFFPQFDFSEWRVRERVEFGADEDNEYAFTRWELEKAISGPPTFEPTSKPTKCPSQLRKAGDSENDPSV